MIKQVDGKRIQIFLPDGVTKTIEQATVNGTQVDFVLPELEVYNVVTIN